MHFISFSFHFICHQTSSCTIQVSFIKCIDKTENKLKLIDQIHVGGAGNPPSRCKTRQAKKKKKKKKKIGEPLAWIAK